MSREQCGEEESWRRRQEHELQSLFRSQLYHYDYRPKWVSRRNYSPGQATVAFRPKADIDQRLSEYSIAPWECIQKALLQNTSRDDGSIVLANNQNLAHPVGS